MKLKFNISSLKKHDHVKTFNRKTLQLECAQILRIELPETENNRQWNWETYFLGCKLGICPELTTVQNPFEKNPRFLVNSQGKRKSEWQMSQYMKRLGCSNTTTFGTLFVSPSNRVGLSGDERDVCLSLS